MNVVVLIEGDVLGFVVDVGDDVGGFWCVRCVIVDAKRGYIAFLRFDGVEVEELICVCVGFVVDVLVMRIFVVFKFLIVFLIKVGVVCVCYFVVVFVFFNFLIIYWVFAVVSFDVCGCGYVGDLFFVLM